MARFTTDHDNLSITVELDTEPMTVDLTTGGLGTSILDAVIDRLILTHQAESAPDGTPWAELKPATVATKRSRQIGTLTGEMLSPEAWRRSLMGADISARKATYQCPHNGRGSLSWGKAHGFHHGGRGRPARPLIGWPPAAIADALELLRAAAQRETPSHQRETPSQ